MLAAAARRVGPMARRLVSGVLVTIIVASALAAVVVVGGEAAGSWRVAPVASGSMVPSFGPGDLVVAEPVDKDALQPGDVLLFNAPIAGRPAVVHRIADRELMDGEPVFHTKGDANSAPDVWTIRIRGSRAWRVTHVVPEVGQAIGWLDDSALRISILILGVGIMLISSLRALWVAAPPIEWQGRRIDRRRRRQREQRSTRRALALTLAGLTVVAVLGMMGLAYAQFTAAPTPPTPAFSSGTLSASSPLTCRWVTSTTISLAWANNSPTFTTGYSVQRSNSSGSGYSQVGTTSPAAVVTYTDTPPAPQTTLRYYVADATHGTWSSAHSNETASSTCIGAINLVAGTSNGFSGDTGQATAAKISNPQDVAVDASGNVYIADTANNRIRRVDAATGVITTIAGGGASTGCAFAGAATSATLSAPQGVAIDGSGTIYISDTGNNCIRTVSGGNISLFAGNGATTACSFSGSPTAVSMSAPRRIAVDASSNLYIVDTTRRCVRKVSGGAISQVAGSGAGPASTCTFSGAATAVILSNSASDVAVDGSGNVYIADTGSDCIRKVSGGTISLFAGSGTNAACSFAGAATAASLSGPTGVDVDSAGRVVIADTGRRCVRLVTSGNVSLLAGTGTSGSTGDNGPAIAALLTAPAGLAASSSGDVWVSDTGSDRIRRVEGPL